MRNIISPLYLRLLYLRMEDLDEDINKRQICIKGYDNGEYITLMDIAERQGISEKYLESIVSLLSKNDFLISLRGKGGGYKLSRRPEEYTVLSVLQCTEGSLAPVACLESKPNKCPKLEECKTITMWENFEKTINDYFNKITIPDLINSGNGIDNYVI